MRNFMGEYGLILCSTLVVVIICSVSMFATLPDTHPAETAKQTEQAAQYQESPDKHVGFMEEKEVNIIVGDDGIDKTLAVIIAAVLIICITGIMKKLIPYIAALIAWYVKG